MSEKKTKVQLDYDCGLRTVSQSNYIASWGRYGKTTLDRVAETKNSADKYMQTCKTHVPLSCPEPDTVMPKMNKTPDRVTTVGLHARASVLTGKTGGLHS